MANMIKKKKTAHIPIIFIYNSKDTENDTVTGF